MPRPLLIAMALGLGAASGAAQEREAETVAEDPAHSWPRPAPTPTTTSTPPPNPLLPPPPPFRPGRYDEDYAYLRDAALRSGAWWEPLKAISLDDADEGMALLSLGGELRVRYEAYENDAWSSASRADHDYVWIRALPYAELRAGERLRLFTEWIAAYELDDEAGTGPADEDRLDVLQAFADGSIPLGSEGATLTLRPGRQVLTYGSERLVGARYGPNVLQAFDAGKAILSLGDWRLDILYAVPVEHREGALDDRPGRAESLWMAYATRELTPGGAAGVDVYCIGSRNRDAVYNQGAGEDLRHTLGARLFGAAAPWDWNLEVFGQAGRFAGGNVLAWSAASDTGLTLEGLLLSPRLWLRANIISGDRDPDAASLETFQPLYPRGNYFGEIGLLGPYNLMNLHPGIDVALTSALGASLGCAAYWRQSLGDGIYDNGGNLLRPDSGSSSRFIGTQLDVAATWRLDRTLDVTAGFSAFFPGRFIADSGEAEIVHFASVEVRATF